MTLRVIWASRSRPPKRVFPISHFHPKAFSTIFRPGPLPTARSCRAGWTASYPTWTAPSRRNVSLQYRRRQTHPLKISIVGNKQGSITGRVRVGSLLTPCLPWTSREYGTRTKLAIQSGFCTLPTISILRRGQSVRGSFLSSFQALTTGSTFFVHRRTETTRSLRRSGLAAGTRLNECTAETGLRFCQSGRTSLHAVPACFGRVAQGTKKIAASLKYRLRSSLTFFLISFFGTAVQVSALVTLCGPLPPCR